MVKLTIDGKQTEVEAGTTVLNAARKAGVDIPTLCDHPELTPYGGCRLCLVEIEGARTLQPSCTLPVSEGMVVRTDTEKIHEARKFVLSMIFSERNHFCPYCQVSGGDCELQNAAYDEDMTHWPIQPNWKPYPMDASHPFIVLEHNRCILCRRCVRACGELIGNFTLGFEQRGANSSLVADLGIPFGESSCIDCGTCVQVCPTGALIDRWSAYQGKETEVDVTHTTCLGCSVGCSIDVLTRDNRLVRIEGDWEGKINGGVLCDVGRFHPMVEDRERVRTPMVRTGSSLKAATWDEALQIVSTKLSTAKQVTATASTRLSLEALQAFKALCEHLSIQKVATTEEGAATNAAYQLLNETSQPFESKLEEAHKADCFVVFGEDLTTDHQVVSFFVKRAIPSGADLIQISDSETGFENFADYSLHTDQKKIAELLSSLTKLLETSSESDLQDVAKKFGLDEQTLKEVVQTLSNAQNPFVIAGTRFAFSDPYAALKSGWDLAKALDAKFMTTKGNINSLGAAQLRMDHPVDLNQAKVVLLALGDEKPSQQFMKKFENVPYLIVMSSYISPLTASADVVLPVANWLEQGGHFLNLDGNILEAQASLEAAEGIFSNVAVFEKLATELKFELSPDWESAIRENPSVVQITK